MFQRLFAVTIVILTILWLVVSYLPGVRALLPVLAFPLDNGWFAALGVLTLLLFVSIQLLLLYRTAKSVRDSRGHTNGSPFQLNLGAEIFWTALPIAMTLILAWASYPLWLNTR